MCHQPPTEPAPGITRFPVLGVLILVFCLQIALMPAFLIEGDAVAIRAITARLLHAGTLSIPTEYADALKDFGEQAGQYFFLHPDGDRMVSKYGILNSLIYVPPVWAHRQLTGIQDPFVFSYSLVFLLNLYNILFALLIAHRLLRIAGLYTNRRGTAWFFVLATMYTTFLWYYLRAQGGEIFQVFFLLCVYDYFARSLRGSPRSLYASLACLTALTLLKSYYILLLPVLAGVWWFAQPRRPAAQRIRSAALAIAVPGIAMVSLLLGIHAWKFGSPFATGYGQFEPGAFTLLPRGEAILGFLVRPDRSLILHAPVVLFALAGWRRFLRGHPHEAGFVGLATLLMVGLVSCFANWPGHWCYGPRYLLILTPLLAIPVIQLFDRNRWVRAGLIAAMIIAAVAQEKVVSKRFLLAYELAGILHEAGVQDTTKIVGERNFSRLYHELDRFSSRGVAGPVVRALRREAPDEVVADAENQLRAQGITNYFWLYPIPQEFTLHPADAAAIQKSEPESKPPTQSEIRHE